MAAAKKTAASKPEPQADEQAPEETVDEVHRRGGWDVGYTGDRVDDADDDAYTVTGVLKAAKADDGDK
ncbi:hypothetical protein ACWET9_06580 [Streptomyces sp. NPDC004059]